jgi:hypothetical protein
VTVVRKPCYILTTSSSKCVCMFSSHPAVNNTECYKKKGYKSCDRTLITDKEM